VLLFVTSLALYLSTMSRGITMAEYRT